MTGRGIDQIMPYSGNPTLYEGYMKRARGYAELAEETNGPIPKSVNFSYVWGDAFAELARRKPIILHMTPMQIKRLRLTHTSENDVLWLNNVLGRKG